MRNIAALMSFVFCLVFLGGLISMAGDGGIGTAMAALVLGPLAFVAPFAILAGGD